NERRALHRFSNDGASNSIFEGTERLFETWTSVTQTGDSVELIGSTLPDVLAEHGIEARSIDILVLDVQGAELECLRGAHKILDHITYIECEVSKEQIYRGGALSHEIVEYLDEAGFDLATQVP